MRQSLIFEIEDFRHPDQGILLTFNPRHFGAISHKKNNFAWSSQQLRLMFVQVTTKQEWWEQEQNVGYTEDDEEPDFYWNDDLKNGNSNGINTDEVNDGEESCNE